MLQKKFKQDFLSIITRKTGSLLLDIGVLLQRRALLSPNLTLPLQSKKKEGEHLALVAGYFSFEDGFATFGDTEAMNITCKWLEKSAIKYDIACHHLNGHVGLSLKDLNPNSYDIFIFTCGPWKENNNDILERFDHCLKIGVNLSIEDINSNRFDLLYPRDLPSQFNPDLVFSSNYKQEPLVGICLVHSQGEYGNKQRHDKVAAAVEDYLIKNDVAFINLDTLYRNNKSGISNTKSFEHLLSRLDVVISSRLHGMVFSLKNETPVVAIDAIAGGAKLTKQAKAIEWPMLLDGDKVDSDAIANAVQLCLEQPLKQQAKKTKGMADKKIAHAESRFIEEIAASLALKQDN